MDLVIDPPSVEIGKVIIGNPDEEYDLEMDDEINARENTDSISSSLP
jgi:hypothetical protein